MARESKFERGFLTRANFPSITDPHHVGWRTVTRVDVGPAQLAPTHREHSPLAGPLQQSLEHLGRCRLDFVAWLREQPLPKLRTLSVVVSPEEWTRFLPGALLTARVALPSLEELDVAGTSTVRSRWHEWTLSFISALNGQVKTLWLPMPAEVPEALRRNGLATLAPDLTLKLATPEGRDGARTVISLSRDGGSMSLAPDETPEFAQYVTALARALSSP